MNFIKAPLELFERYGITPSRVLSDREGIQHFELTNPLWIQFKYEPTCTFWTDEALRAYIEWTEPEVI